MFVFLPRPIQETRLGRTINQLRRSTDDPEIQKKAKKLLKSWQKFVKPANTASPTASASAASTTDSSSSSSAAAASSSLAASSSSVAAAARPPAAVNGVRHRPHPGLPLSSSSSSAPGSAVSSPALKLRPLPPLSQKALPSILKRSSSAPPQQQQQPDAKDDEAARRSDEICDKNNETDSADNNKTSPSSSASRALTGKDSSSSSSSPACRAPPVAKKRVRFDCVERIDSPVSRTKLATSPPRQSAPPDKDAAAAAAAASAGGGSAASDAPARGVDSRVDGIGATLLLAFVLLCTLLRSRQIST